MDVTDQDIDIAGTEADDSVRQSHEPPPDRASGASTEATSDALRPAGPPAGLPVTGPAPGASSSNV